MLGGRTVKVPPRGPGDRGREAKVALRAGTVLLRRPRHAVREGSERPATDVASEAQIAAAAALCPTLEGKTDRQRNHHPPGSLAWMARIAARPGGWTCSDKPPGPKTMRDGWQRFAAIAEGFSLAHNPVRNV